MKRILLLAVVLLLLAGAAGWAVWWQFQSFLETPLDLPAAGHSFNLAPGSHGADIVTELASLGFTREGWEWKLLMRLEPQVYRAGEYWLELGLKPRGLLRKFAGGWVVQHRVTLIEGWTFRQVVAALAEHPVLEQNLDPADPHSVDVLSAVELRPDIETALAGISPEFRAAVVLVDLEGMSLDGAADTLDIPVGTVKSRLFRARKQLAQELGNLAPGSEHQREEP